MTIEMDESGFILYQDYDNFFGQKLNFDKKFIIGQVGMASCGAKAYFSNIKIHPKLQEVEGFKSPLVCEVGFKEEENEITEEDKEREKEKNQINLCLHSGRPNLSIYNYCQKNFDEHGKNSMFFSWGTYAPCSVNMCQLCCITTNEWNIKQVKLSDKFIQKCFKDCMETFMPDNITQ